MVNKPKKNTRSARHRNAKKTGVTRIKSAEVKTSFRQGVREGAAKSKDRIHDYKLRRPHRSFRLTKRRDYARSFEMPGYIAFSNSVWKQIFRAKNTFILLVVFAAVAFAVLVGIMSQETYSAFGNALDKTTEDIAGGDFGQVGRASLLLLTTAVTGGLNQAPTEVQQIFSVLIFLIVWLVTVWLLRHQLAGVKVKLRDGLYRACAPLISTAIVAVIIFIQATPALLTIVVYSAAATTGFLETPFYAIIFWTLASAMFLLSLFLVTSSFFALVVVTSPDGWYPFQAIRISGDLVTSRRLRLLLRLVWMAFCVVLLWIVTMIPLILLDNWLTNTFHWENLSLVPVALLVVSSVSIIFMSSYVYLLYRRLIADDADPA